MKKPASNISSPKGKVMGLFVPNADVFTTIGNHTETNGSVKSVVTGQVCGRIPSCTHPNYL